MTTTTERIDVLSVMERARMGYEFTAGCEEGERQMRAARAAVAELIDALRGLVDECETNMDFATAHRSELDALTTANDVLASVCEPYIGEEAGLRE